LTERIRGINHENEKAIAAEDTWINLINIMSKTPRLTKNYALYYSIYKKNKNKQN
jgi:hypothetical protein